jgi:hypothetical protein
MNGAATREPANLRLEITIVDILPKALTANFDCIVSRIFSFKERALGVPRWAEERRSPFAASRTTC